MTDNQLFNTAEATTYQMQSWDHADACTCGLDRNTDVRGHLDKCLYPATTHSWVPMENGAASARWKPKKDVRAAVMQAATWAGGCSGVGIPAMQVVEIPSGCVIWRDSARYPAAGLPVAPPWQAELYAAAKAELATDESRPEQPEHEPDSALSGHQEALFDA